MFGQTASPVVERLVMAVHIPLSGCVTAGSCSNLLDPSLTPSLRWVQGDGAAPEGGAPPLVRPATAGSRLSSGSMSPPERVRFAPTAPQVRGDAASAHMSCSIASIRKHAAGSSLVQLDEVVMVAACAVTGGGDTNTTHFMKHMIAIDPSRSVVSFG